MRFFRIAAALAVLLAPVSAWALSCPSLPVTFVTNTLIQAPDFNSDFSDLYDCFEGALAGYSGAVSSGTPNAQTLTYANGPSAYSAGTIYNYIVGAGLANTGAATLNVNGLGAVAIQIGAQPLIGGEMQPGEVVAVYYDGSVFQLLTQAVRLRLAAALTLYVGPTGTDTANNCTQSGAPCATLQHAYTVLQQEYDLNGQQVTIQLADGTYTASLSVNGILLGQNGIPLIIAGDATTPANTVIAISGTSVSDITINYGAIVQVQNLEVKNTASAPFNYCMNVGNNAVLYLKNIIYAGCGSSDTEAGFHGTVYVLPGSADVISASVGTHFEAYWNSVIDGCGSPGGCTLTLQNTPNFSGAFSHAFGNAIVVPQDITFSGQATGARCNAADNGVVDSGANQGGLPGNSAGSAANGGICD